MVRKIDFAQSDPANFSLRYLDERRIDAARLCELVHVGKDDALLLRPEIVVIDRYVHTVVSPALKDSIEKRISRSARDPPLLPSSDILEVYHK